MMDRDKNDLEAFYRGFASPTEENPWKAVVTMWRQIRAGGATWSEAIHLCVAMMADLRQQKRDRGELE